MGNGGACSAPFSSQPSAPSPRAAAGGASPGASGEPEELRGWRGGPCESSGQGADARKLCGLRGGSSFRPLEGSWRLWPGSGARAGGGSASGTQTPRLPARSLRGRRTRRGWSGAWELFGGEGSPGEWNEGCGTLTLPSWVWKGVTFLWFAKRSTRCNRPSQERGSGGCHGRPYRLAHLGARARTPGLMHPLGPLWVDSAGTFGDCLMENGVMEAHPAG